MSRGIFRILVKNFVDSLKPRQFRGEVVGKDHLGNTYYQIEGNDRQKKQRWFEPKDKDNFEQEIPAEWESWLRYRRKVRPTDDEVLKNAAIAAQKKINAAKLESQRKLPPPPLTKPTTGMESFPSYDDYEIAPGKSSKK